MTARRILRHSLAIHRGLLSKPAARRGTAIIVGAVTVGVMVATPPTAAGPGSTSAQWSVRASLKAAPGDRPSSTARAQGSVRGSYKATPGDVGDDGSNPGNKFSPRGASDGPRSSVRAQQTAVRRARDGYLRIVSRHGPARSSITRIIARDNGDGTRTVADQHGSSTFNQRLVEALQRATARRWAAAQRAAAPAPPPGALAAPPGQAPVATGPTWTIVVGGAGDPNGNVFTGEDAVVHYSAALTGASTREGVNELNRMIREHRAAHPGDHIKVVGYSQGAAVVHTWAAENGGTIDNVNAVLIADPKRDAGPGAAGLSGQPITQVVGAPTAGADRNFGNIPTVSVCTDDVICDSSARSGWGGYFAQPSAHGNYSFNVDDYSNTGDGQWYNGRFIPW
jgi:cutinase